MQDDSALDRAMAVVADLRARCPWDRLQTRETLRPYLIEEVHELAAAIADGDRASIRDEVGDLMLHLAWQLVLGAEQNEFSAAEIASDVVAKMHRRHPHLFALGPAEGWLAIKRRERDHQAGALSGIPATLPELLMAFRLQERAAGTGFDWPDADGPLAKVREELTEVEQELARREDNARDRIADELGDLLFAVVNLARKIDVDPSAALERANRKFRRRFEAIERIAAERGTSLDHVGLDQMDLWWDEVKREEAAPDQG